MIFECRLHRLPRSNRASAEVTLMMQGTSFGDEIVGISKIVVYVCWGRVLDELMEE